jgi:hypothetical protein
MLGQSPGAARGQCGGVDEANRGRGDAEQSGNWVALLGLY